MGRDELLALAKIIGEQTALGRETALMGTWTIRWNKERQAFEFDKCEFEGYCEERPAVVALDGTVLDRGGPLFDAPQQ
jgi:hypothetical protein